MLTDGRLFSQVGHYTALIWNATTHLGCATCPSAPNGFEINVCQYADSTPNVIGGSGGVEYFVANVPQSNTPAASEATCCAETYGGLATGTSGAAVDPVVKSAAAAVHGVHGGQWLAAGSAMLPCR